MVDGVKFVQPQKFVIGGVAERVSPWDSPAC